MSSCLSQLATSEKRIHAFDQRLRQVQEADPAMLLRSGAYETLFRKYELALTAHKERAGIVSDLAALYDQTMERLRQHDEPPHGPAA